MVSECTALLQMLEITGKKTQTHFGVYKKLGLNSKGDLDANC